MKDVEMTPQTQRPNPMLRQQSKYEKLDKTKFFKHYMPDDSFFEQKSKCVAISIHSFVFIASLA